MKPHKYELVPHLSWRRTPPGVVLELWEKVGGSWLLVEEFASKVEAMLKIDVLGIRDDVVEVPLGCEVGQWHGNEWHYERSR